MSWSQLWLNIRSVSAALQHFITGCCPGFRECLWCNLISKLYLTKLSTDCCEIVFLNMTNLLKHENIECTLYFIILLHEHCFTLFPNRYMTTFSWYFTYCTCCFAGQIMKIPIKHQTDGWNSFSICDNIQKLFKHN